MLCRKEQACWSFRITQMFSHEKIIAMQDKRAASDFSLMFTCCIIFNLSLKALAAHVLLVSKRG